MSEDKNQEPKDTKVTMCELDKEEQVVEQSEDKQQTSEHTKFNLKQAIVDKLDETKKYPGSMIIPNNSRKEVNVWFTKLAQEIESKQEERKAFSQDKLDQGGYLYWNLDQDNRLIVTEDEADLMQTLRETVRMLHQGMEETDSLKDSGGATNFPEVAGAEVPPVILGVNEKNYKDPVARIKNRLGLSVNRWVPLWMSGFRVEIEGPATLDLLNLETRIVLDKIESSAESYGYALTSSNVYMDRVLIEFILDHIVKTTAGVHDSKSLKRLISLADFDMLVLGAASTIFPDGYPMERTMFRDSVEGIVGEKRKRKLNIWRMKAVRLSHFTEDEKRRVGIMGGIVPKDELIEHRKNIRQDVSRFVNIGNDTYVKLHIPNLEEYLRIGLRFNTGMEDRAKEVLGLDISEDQRKIYLARASDITRVMYLSHWIEGIYFKDGDDGEMVASTQRVSDPNASDSDIKAADDIIAKVLEDISVFPNKADELIDAIEQFISKMRLALAVVPREPNTIVEKGEHPYVVTINPAEIFFTLLRHKILMAGG